MPAPGKKPNRIGGECYICVDRKNAGEEVKQTIFLRLTQHLKVKHGVDQDKRRKEVSRQKVIRTAGRTKHKRKYVECTYNNCGLFVCEKSRHLTQVHKLVAGSEESQVAMKTAFKKGPSRMFKPVPTGCRQTSGLPAFSHETSVESDSSPSEDDDDDISTTQGTLPTQGSGLRLMTPGDVHFRKWGRLVPNDCMLFPVVKTWHVYRTSRAGKNKGKRMHTEDSGYVNRFLAHGNFAEDGWSAITRDYVTVHEEAMSSRDFEPGTISRILEAILDFWEWSHAEGYVRRRQFESVRMYIQGCRTSNNKDKKVRNTARRTTEDAELPTPEIYDRLLKSDYTTTTKEMFKLQPSSWLYDMGCVMVASVAMFNAPRASAIFGMRVDHVNLAKYVEGKELWSVGVPYHKTGAFGFVSFFNLTTQIYNDLQAYVKAVKKFIPELSKDDRVFRDNKLNILDKDGVNRMYQRAYKKAGVTRNFTLTENRKMTTVYARADDPSKAGVVARQLCHSTKTADMYYAVREDRNTSVDAFTHIKQAFYKTTKKTATATSCAPDQMDLTDERTEEHQTDEQPPTDEDLDMIPPSPKASSSHMQPRVVLHDAKALMRAVHLIKPAKQRHFVSPQTKMAIKDCYTEVILEFSLTFRTVPMETVRGLREGRWPELSDTQLRDIVRNMVKSQKRQNGDGGKSLMETMGYSGET